MRAIIIDEKDALALIDALHLEKLEEKHPFFPQAQDGHERLTAPEKERMRWIVDAVHRRFHHRVVTWLQDQGARCVR